MKTAVHKLASLLCLSLLCLSLVLLASTRAHSQAAANSQTQAKIYPIPFQTLAIGASSGCARPARLLIRDEKEWQRVWGIHALSMNAGGIATQPESQVALPAIDWSRQAVVALLMGEVSGTADTTSIEIVQVVHTPYDTVIFYRETRPEEAAKTNAIRVQPVHFALIDKPATPLRFVNLSAPDCATCVLGAKP
ncbi:MAG TPA: hypothetical protein VF600_02245 [Abditibacteriaceae bacterium]|jgi:hypothetical protein